MGPFLPVVYDIDGSDRIVRVNDAWSATAEEGEAPGLRAPQVLGRSLWDFVEDQTTRQLYVAMLERARTGTRPLSFAFRCDTPTLRRLMQMRITGLGGGAVSFEVRLIAAQPRPRVALLEPSLPREGFVRMCSWCKRLPLPTGEWVEIEAAMKVLDILDTVPLPAISHGMCPQCYRAVVDRLDRDPRAGENDVTLGPLPGP